MLFQARTVCLLLLTAVTAIATAESIGPIAARDKVFKKVTVEMKVKSARHLKKTGLCFLNSEKNYRNNDNLAIVIPREALADYLGMGIDDVAAHYINKSIRVTGKITLHREWPQIRIDSAKQIETVKESVAEPKTTPQEVDN